MSKEPFRYESSFLSRAIKYKEGLRRGFLVHPHNEDGTSWGEPFEDAQGNPIEPGTVGGPNPNAVLGVKDDKWFGVRNPKKQAVGNIDWKGEWLNDAATKRRVVTVNGPSQRYWNTGSFKYDSDSAINKNHYVYYNGKVCAVAPYPVLGACCVSQEFYARDLYGNYVRDFTTGGLVKEDIDCVVVVCKRGSSDVVYLRKEVQTILPADITEDIFQKHARLQSNIPPEEPGVKGWHLLGEFPGIQDEVPGVDPEAPWFFNVKGTQCRTMRRCEYTHLRDVEGHDPNATIEPFEDQLYRELSCTIDFTNMFATFRVVDVLENTTGPQTHKKWYARYYMEKGGPTEYAQSAIDSPDGNPHMFWSGWMTCGQSIVGRSKVAVDYHPDEEAWVYGWLAGQCYHLTHHDYSECMDDTTGVDWWGNPYDYEAYGPSPDSDYNGVGTWQGWKGPYPRPSVPEQQDQYPDEWWGFTDVITLNINRNGTDHTPLYAEIALLWGRTGSKSVMNGLPPDPQDRRLAFVECFDTWLKYVDLRHNMVVGETLYNFIDHTQTATYPNAPVSQEQFVWSVVGTDNINTAPHEEPYDLFQVYETPISEAADTHVFTQYATRPVFGGGIFVGTQYVPWLSLKYGDGENDGYYLTEVTSENYSATMFWEDFPDEAPYLLYDLYSFIPVWMRSDTRPRWERLTITEMLRSPECESEGIFGMTELYEHLVYMEYFDPLEKREVARYWSNSVDGDPVEVMNGGTRLYPGGLI